MDNNSRLMQTLRGGAWRGDLLCLRIVWLFVCGSRRASRPAKQRRGPMGFCISLLRRDKPNELRHAGADELARR